MKIGCPPIIVKVICSFHVGMISFVLYNENTSDALPVSNGTKQGCIMAPLLFGIIFTAMLNDAFKSFSKGVMIRFRKDGGVFNQQHLKARS